MAGLAKKQETVENLKADLQQASVAVVTDYRGLTVAELTDLRRELYKEGAKFTVAKNTLTRKAIDGSQIEAIAVFLKGPTAIAYGTADPMAPIKILKDFLKKNKKENEIRGGYLDGSALSAAEIEMLAALPPIEELRAKLLGGIASPLNGLVASLSGPQRALVNVLDQYAKQQQG